MVLKLSASKKAIDTLQQELSELVNMLLQVDDMIGVLPFDKYT